MAGKLFEGIIVPLLLPLDETEKIIEPELVTEVKYLLDRGIHGFLVPSGTGEFYNLSYEERRRAVEIVVAEVRGRVPIISMAADCGRLNALKLIEAARHAGADGAMVTPPYFSPVDQATLKRFFCFLADEGGLPLWLYHQPAHTKLTIEPWTVAELAENPNIVGIKASAWVDLLYYEQLVRALRHKPEFRILMGEDNHMLSGLILGGHGAVSTLANLLPDEFVALWDAIKVEDLAKARTLQDRIMDVIEPLVFAFPNWQAACKVVMRKRRIFSSIICAEPCMRLSPGDERKVEELCSVLHLC